VLVADTINYRVQRFTPDGAVIDRFGSRGSGNGQFPSAPSDVTVHGEDVYVSEVNNRIHRFRAGVAPPVLGRAVNVRTVRGRVFVRVPARRSRAAANISQTRGSRFVPLRAGRQIPVGSLLDTRRGTVRLTSATTRAGRTQTSDFSAGIFSVVQSRRRSARGLTELRLSGGNFRRSCRARSSALAQTSATSRRRVRRLRARGRGRFRTRGRHASATVRGTTWATEDRCDGTLVSVSRGRVDVRDFRRRRTIRLRAGRRYLARAPGA
jgi:hypothetical protein